MARRRAHTADDPDERAFDAAALIVFTDPLFAAMTRGCGTRRQVWTERTDDGELVLKDGWARVDSGGRVVASRHRRAAPDEWVWVLAHCLLHLGFGHLDAHPADPPDQAGAAAACLEVVRFQRDLRLGRPPVPVPADLPGGDAAELARRWRDTGVPPQYATLGVGGYAPDTVRLPAPVRAVAATGITEPTWAQLFAVGLASAATAAVQEAGHSRRADPDRPDPDSPWERARRWFVSSYPLLGALASGFRIVADVDVARAHNIAVATVDPALGEIYLNPLRNLDGARLRFVLAHEMLHAALRHGSRVAHRDPYLWNVAADYVINGWLVEMGIGEAPDGVLYDLVLNGLSTEAVYDRIAGDLRRMRKVATLRGRGLGDVLSSPLPGVGEAVRAGDLDDFYRRALTAGLASHESSGRGLLPAGLVAEIRVLDHPAPAWDVRLARWFDEHFPAAERRRSYARPSRRQGTTPHIPRPGLVRPEENQRRSTFGVVLDTSGSMSNRLLGKALGAVASYAIARDVPAARVVFCDAVAYDGGYLPVEQIAGRVRVRGRGGTILQPGVRLLERADDFPADGPILIITDGQCDPVRVRRSHAFLVPAGARLPFTPRGPVFRMS